MPVGATVSSLPESAFLLDWQQYWGALFAISSFSSSLPLLVRVIKSIFIMRVYDDSVWAVLAASGNGLCNTFHAGSLSISKNGIFRLHYKIKLLIELKIVYPF